MAPYFSPHPEFSISACSELPAILQLHLGFFSPGTGSAPVTFVCLYSHVCLSIFWRVVAVICPVTLLLEQI